MKASKFSDAQKAFIVKQGEDGTPVAEICRKAGISEAPYFDWKKKYAGLRTLGASAARTIDFLSIGFPVSGYSEEDELECPARANLIQIFDGVARSAGEKKRARRFANLI